MFSSIRWGPNIRLCISNPFLFWSRMSSQLRACCCHLLGSEVAIAAIEARPNSPQWLQEEVAKTRRGLMRLRQNVVLLRNSDEPDSFFPVRRPVQSQGWCVCKR